jgi:cell shape-determining protein MreC
VSDRESLPESHPLPQLAQLVRSLGDELAAFRKRALQAEATLRGYEKSTRTGDLFAPQRVEQLEKENADLRARLEFATEQTRAILAQVRFLRQQSERPVTGSQAVVGNGLEAARGVKPATRGPRGAR